MDGYDSPSDRMKAVPWNVVIGCLTDDVRWLSADSRFVKIIFCPIFSCVSTDRLDDLPLLVLFFHLINTAPYQILLLWQQNGLKIAPLCWALTIKVSWLGTIFSLELFWQHTRKKIIPFLSHFPLTTLKPRCDIFQGPGEEATTEGRRNHLSPHLITPADI